MRWVEIEIRVRYAECDPMGVVHHANYFVWYEMGRLALAQAAGVDFSGLAAEGTDLPVAECRCQYKAPARFDDLLLLRTALERPRVALLEFSYQLLRRRGHQLLATGGTKHPLARRQGGVLLRLPADLQARIDAFLAGG